MLAETQWSPHIAIRSRRLWVHMKTSSILTLAMGLAFAGSAFMWVHQVSNPQGPVAGEDTRQQNSPRIIPQLRAEPTLAMRIPSRQVSTSEKLAKSAALDAGVGDINAIAQLASIYSGQTDQERGISPWLGYELALRDVQTAAGDDKTNPKLDNIITYLQRQQEPPRTSE
jgi:hypothetical protein